MLISQLVLLPVFGVVIWGYFFFTSNCKDHRYGKVYDTVIICLAAGLSLLIANETYSLNYGDYAPAWKPVFAALSSAHVFPLTMLAGMRLKLKLFQ